MNTALICQPGRHPHRLPELQFPRLSKKISTWTTTFSMPRDECIVASINRTNQGVPVVS